MMHASGALAIVDKGAWLAFNKKIASGAKAVLLAPNTANPLMACNDLGWWPAEAHTDERRLRYLWRLTHTAPPKVRAARTKDGGHTRPTGPSGAGRQRPFSWSI